VRKDCTVGKLSECNEAGDEETVDVMSYVYRVGVAQPQSELHMRSRSYAATIRIYMGGVGVGNGWSPYTVILYIVLLGPNDLLPPYHSV
jgi:hypothetical protein